MNMMTPVTGTAPSTAIPVAPIRPVAPASGSADTAAQDDRQQDDRGDGSETTLRYKFDWLLQRQVNTGALSSDKAAEMIRLFERTVTGPTSGEDGDRDGPGDAPLPDVPSVAKAAGDLDMANALVEQLRVQFGASGPYDDTGNPSASMPVGIMVDDRA